MNGTLPCVDFMDVIMGDIPYITTLCLNGTLPCDDFMDIIMGDIPYITTLCVGHFHVLISWMLSWEVYPI